MAIVVLSRNGLPLTYLDKLSLTNIRYLNPLIFSIYIMFKYTFYHIINTHVGCRASSNYLLSRI
jgi:hypothetical protein